MDTIEQLIAAGRELEGRVVFQGEPDWQAEGANIPDDVYPEEDAPDAASQKNRDTAAPDPANDPVRKATQALLADFARIAAGYLVSDGTEFSAIFADAVLQPDSES